jgi:predicted CoA-substrate-specific enzyme activase
MAIHVGVDVGTVSVKLAVFSADPEDAPVFDRLVAEARFRRVVVGRAGNGTGTGSGRPAWLAVAPCTRIAANPAGQARAVLDVVRGLMNGSRLGSVRGTGTGAGLLEQELGIEPAGEFPALARAVECLLPSVLTLFEIGGESSKYVRFERHRSDGQLGIADYQTNGDCAAGTGAFLDQQAGRLRLRIEDLGSLALASRRTASIAGRCSVFAKSDMIHAQQRGFTPEEIMAGLCQAVAQNFRSSITKGRTIVPDVALVGGVAANAAVVRALEKTFGWEPGALIVPPDHASFAALGAALLAHQDAKARASTGPTPADPNPAGPWNGTGNGNRAQSTPCGTSPGDRAVSSPPPLSMANVLLLRDRMTRVPVEALDAPVEAFLGIDIGSVSTNLVVIDADGRVLEEIYLRTEGRPVEVVDDGLRRIQRELGSRIRICGVGTTGSGRELIAELAGADTVKDEITAHTTGAAFVDQRLLGLGVDTIFEIGGQDAKFISLQDGIVVDFAMNEACAAGTGSFLEERALELGIRIEGEFASIALGSSAPCRLGERCTVFMEKDVSDSLRRGAALESVVAGLAHSVATNYINRVVRGRRIGDVIFFQGGTAYNDAVAAALSGILGKRIIVPPFNGVMGALGVALLARDRMRGSGRASRFRGFALDAVAREVREFTCKACTNHCQIQRFTIEGEHSYWGDKCSVKYRKAARSDRQPVTEDLMGLRQERLLEGYDPGAGAGPVVGMPLCMSTYDWAPFWLTAFRELGVRVLLSEPTTNQIVKLGIESTVSAPCFPIQVAHGHIRWLLQQDVDFVFVPNNIAAPGDSRTRAAFFCPWQQTLPFVARAAPFIFEHRSKILAPTLWYNQGARAVAAALREALAGAGLRFPGRRVERAIDRAFRAQASFRAFLLEAGRVAVQKLDQSGGHAVVLLGRAYNVHDAGSNLDIAAKLRRYYGADVVPFDCIDLHAPDLARWEETMFWSYGARLLAAAAFTRDRPKLHLVYVTNFACGPDSYVKHYVAEASGRPFLTLQFDGHNNDAGMLTRCEAYLHSKGALA